MSDKELVNMKPRLALIGIVIGLPGLALILLGVAEAVGFGLVVVGGAICVAAGYGAGGAAGGT